MRMDKLKTEWDPKSCSTAMSVSREMESFDFMISVVVVQGLLQYLTLFSNSLQNPACDLPAAARNANMLVTLLQEKREDNLFEKL